MSDTITGDDYTPTLLGPEFEEATFDNYAIECAVENNDSAALGYVCDCIREYHGDEIGRKTDKLLGKVEWWAREIKYPKMNR